MTTKYIVVTPGTRDSIQIDNPFELLDFAQHEILRLVWLIPDLLRSIHETIVSTLPPIDTIQ